MLLNVYIKKIDWEIEVGGSRVQGHPQLPSKVEASLSYMDLLSETQKRKKESVRAIFQMRNWNLRDLKT